MTTTAPTPVDVPTSVTPIAPPTSGPQNVPPGPGTTGRIPTVPTPIGPPETAPPPVPPGAATGQLSGTAISSTIPVSELPVDAAASAETANERESITVPQPMYVNVLDDGTTITRNTRVLNFTGSGVTVTGTGSQANINITGGGGGGGTPGGSNTQIQFNNSGSFAGSSNLTFDNSAQVLAVGGNIIPLGNAVYSLGNATNQWAELYVSNNSIIIGGVTLAVSGNTLSVNGTDLVTNTALGVDAGGIMQGYSAIAIGTSAGNSNQGLKAIAIGDNCGRYSQSANAIAIGSVSGRDFQGIEAVAFGRDTGLNYQGNRAMAMGTQAGSSYQGEYAIALGYRAGQYTQGANSVALGAYAGIGELSGGFQGNNSIVINATGANLTNQTANTFTVAPVRNLSNVGNVMFYNAATSEITYGNTISVAGNITGNYFIGNGSQLTGIVGSYGNANVAANLAAFGSNPISTTGNITAGNFIGGGAGTPTLSSATNLDLSAVSSVRVIGGGTFRLPSLTTAQIANLIPANGDMIYNSSINKFQGYENGAWANII